jgi:hypothetical protein
MAQLYRFTSDVGRDWGPQALARLASGRCFDHVTVVRKKHVFSIYFLFVALLSVWGIIPFPSIAPMRSFVYGDIYICIAVHALFGCVDECRIVHRLKRSVDQV